MPLSDEETDAVRSFLRAFNLEQNVQLEAVGTAVFSQKQLVDIDQTRDYINRFLQRCEKRDPIGTKALSKRVNAMMNGSDKMTVVIDFLVRCRQTRLFYSKGISSAVVNHEDLMEHARTPSNASAQSSPFQRRSASRTRVLSTLTGDTMTNDTTKTRSNSSFNSYDSRYNGTTTSSRHLGMERPAQRPKSPFRNINSFNKSFQSTPISASNHLFGANGFDSSTSTPINPRTIPIHRDGSPYQFRTPMSANTSHMIPTESIRTHSTISSTPLHSRIGSAICETESTVCECLCAALIGIESRLFRSDGNRKMIITTTASLSTTHASISTQILRLSDVFLNLSHREARGEKRIEPITEALLASVRFILGEYTADIDALRKTRNLTFVKILPIIDHWRVKLLILSKCHNFRKLDQLVLLDTLYVLYKSFGLDDERRSVLEKVLEYTMGVFCKQMIEWMRTGEVPCEKWIIEKNKETSSIEIRKIPKLLNPIDAKILLEIGKSLPRIDTASDEDLLAIDQATSIVSMGISPKLIFNNELTPILRSLRDVVCGIVMRTVLTNGRLKDHLNKAKSFFFLVDPRFTTTLYQIIKEASMGLRVGTATLSKQTVSSALASALQASTNHVDDEKNKRLGFKLDSLTSLGNTPNVSSRLQFVKPLRPKYEPVMELMKPIFSACDDCYEEIFHVIWSIDLARLSSQEAASNLPQMIRFLELNYSLRENAWSLLKLMSHIFYLINSTLSRIRSTIAINVELQFARFLAAIDEKCVDVDDVVEEHYKFVRRAAVVVYCKENEVIEQQISVFLQTVFEAQEIVNEFSRTWDGMIETAGGDLNVLKAKMAENCKKRVVAVRGVLDKLNIIQKKIIDELDHQAVFGNDALVE